MWLSGLLQKHMSQNSHCNTKLGAK